MSCCNCCGYAESSAYSRRLSHVLSNSSTSLIHLRGGPRQGEQCSEAPSKPGDISAVLLDADSQRSHGADDVAWRSNSAHLHKLWRGGMVHFWGPALLELRRVGLHHSSSGSACHRHGFRRLAMLKTEKLKVKARQKNLWWAERRSF